MVSDHMVIPTYDLNQDPDFTSARDKIQRELFLAERGQEERKLAMITFILGWSSAVKAKAPLYHLRIESSNGQPVVAAISLAQQFSDAPTPPKASDLVRAIKAGCITVAESVPWPHAHYFLERAKMLNVQARAIRVEQGKTRHYSIPPQRERADHDDHPHATPS